MNLIFIKISTFFRIILIALIVALAAFLSIPAMIINPSGYLSYLSLRMSAKLILLTGGVKINYTGMENIDRKKIQVFASNHTSNFDVPILYSVIPVQLGWLAKKELFNIPFLGWLMKANKFIPIYRGEGRKAIESLHEAVNKIKAGTRIIIFPEGTRSLDGKLQPFKKLIFRLCLKTGVPIVPFYIKGAYGVQRSGSLLIRPGTIYVKIGNEIDTTKYFPNKIMDLMNDLKDSMINLEQDM